MITVRRVYDPPVRGEGWRVLVDRLWPRGLAKTAVGFDDWRKKVAPTTELRRWFSHDPARFAEFARRYREELRHKPEALEGLLSAAHAGPVVLLYAARDVVHNHAVILRDYVQSHLHE